MRSTSAVPSPGSIPTSTSSPWWMAAMASPATSTRALVTRCSRAFTAAPPRRRSTVARPLALMLLEQPLAQSNMLGGDLHQLIVIDEFQGLLQAELHRRGQDDALVGPRSPHVVQLLGPGGVDHQVVAPGMDADDHRLRSEEHTSELQSRGHLV